MLSSRGGDPLLTCTGVVKTLYRDRVRVFNPDRKDSHWAKLKLKRDE